MVGLDAVETLFVVTAFLFQVVLIIHFALRKWRFDTAIRYGPIVYALSIPAVVVSVVLLRNGMEWFFWAGGVLYLLWALFGFLVEYRMKTEWRSAVRWGILGPYVFLYLATVMFF